MFQAWTLWGLLMIALLFNSLYASFSGQSRVKADPRLRAIELAYARRQQVWSWVCVAIIGLGGYLDLHVAHDGWFGLYRSVSLAMTVAYVGGIYIWHERMVRQLPSSSPSDDPAERAP